MACCFGEPGLLFPAAIGLGETAAAPEAVEWMVLLGMYFVAGAVPVRTVRGEVHYLVEPGRPLSHAVRTRGILGHCLTVNALSTDRPAELEQGLETVEPRYL